MVSMIIIRIHVIRKLRKEINNMQDNKGLKNVKLPLIIVTLILVAAFTVFVVLKPDQALNGIYAVENWALSGLGPFLEAIMLIFVIIVAYFAFGKYKNIKLGEGDPEYSTFTYIAMMFMGSMASAAIYWSFTEWAYYYQAPGLNFPAESTDALELSLGYQFFHWGISFNCLYMITAICIAYAFYVRKVPIMQVSAVCEAMMGNFKYKKGFGYVIEFIVVFGIIGGLSVSLGAAIPLIAGALTQLFGIPCTVLVEFFIILGLTVIFAFTSVLGTKKGMANLSTWTAYITIAFLVYVIIVGPTTFILRNTCNAVGWMIDIFPRASLFTDPIVQSGFADSWTIFFMAFFTNYCGMMGIFIAKISKGRTLGQMAICGVGGLTVGTIFLFGTLGSFSIDAFLTGKADVLEILTSGLGQEGIYKIVEVMPGGAVIVPVILFLIICGFVCSSLDTASLGLAQATTKVVDEEGNASAKLRVFWCICLGAIPLALIAAGGSMDPLKQLSIIISIPFVAIMVFMTIKTFKWMKEDSENGVLEENNQMRLRELEEKRAAKLQEKAEEAPVFAAEGEAEA